MNEDFVPFELAKKLKEKGFQQDYNIFGYKLIYSNNTTIKYISNIAAYDKEYFGENIPCPTIPQVLKWLRDKGVHIQIVVWDKGWYFEVWEFEDASCTLKRQSSDYSSYEQAVIKGIEYVFDNMRTAQRI